MEIGIFDIARAHFVPKADRKFHIERPDEAKVPGDGDVVGRLNRSMYGFGNAGNNWILAESSPVRRVCSWQGQSSVVLRQRNSRGLVHGDDFYVLANSGKMLASKYKVRESHRLGLGKLCTKTAVACCEQNHCVGRE